MKTQLYKTSNTHQTHSDLAVVLEEYCDVHDGVESNHVANRGKVILRSNEKLGMIHDAAARNLTGFHRTK